MEHPNILGIYGPCFGCPHWIEQLGHCWLDYEDLGVAKVPIGCPLDRFVAGNIMWGMPVVGEA